MAYPRQLNFQERQRTKRLRWHRVCAVVGDLIAWIVILAYALPK